MYTSEHLRMNDVYTREDLRRKFDITDATIKNGIFRPKGHESVWLFVTEEKAPDRTQYADRLDGNDLYMDGQTAGLRDKLLVEHDVNGLEVILFYQKTKSEYPGAGFRYEGRFRYIDHRGKHPAHFHFQRSK